MKAIEQWHVPGISYPGKNKDEKGKPLFGIYKREYKQTEEVRFFHNGHCNATYKYDKKETTFNSSMHSWQNLWYCGGFDAELPDRTFRGSDMRLFKAVRDKQKPVGFIVGDEGKVDYFESLCRSSGLLYHAHEITGDKWEIGFTSLSGRMRDCFDVNMFRELYLSHNILLGETKFDRYLSGDINYFLSGCYDYANPETDTELFIVGMLLGYHPLSTVSVIQGKNK